MRINRVRLFKKSGEITLTVSTREAANLCHAIECKDCAFPEENASGKAILAHLAAEAFHQVWNNGKEGE